MPTHADFTAPVEEIVDGKLKVIEYTVLSRYCRKCRAVPHVGIDGVLPKERFGIGTISKGGALKQMGLTFGQIVNVVRMFTRRTIARSTAVHFYDVSADARRDTYDQMKIELRSSRNIHGDETGWYINGVLVWLWVFRGEKVTIYEIDKSRSRKVPPKVLGDYSGCIASDSYGAWNHVGTVHQKCLVHYMRELVDTLQYKNPGSEFIPFARVLKRILHGAIDEGKGQKKGDPEAVKRRKVRRMTARVQRLIDGEHTEEKLPPVRQEAEEGDQRPVHVHTP